MEVISQRRTWGNSIKDKKNQIIHRQFEEECSTPIRTITKQISQEDEANPSIQLFGREKIYPQTSIKKDRIKQEISNSEPKNAFTKKCFQKRRKIVPIQNLLQTHNSRTHRNTLITDSENSEYATDKRKALKSVLSSKQQPRSRSPFISSASSSIAESIRPQRSTKNRSVSQSKRIKLSITHGGNDC